VPEGRLGRSPLPTNLVTMSLDDHDSGPRRPRGRREGATEARQPGPREKWGGSGDGLVWTRGQRVLCA